LANTFPSYEQPNWYEISIYWIGWFLFLSLQVIDLGQSSSSGGWQRQAACKLASHGHERDEREEKWS